MIRRLVAPIVAVFLVVGCTQDREQSPTAPGGPEFLTGATCTYNNVKKHARDLFGPSATGTTLANQMSKFAQNTTQATNLGFDIFREIEKKRDATPENTWNPQAELAAKLTEQVIFCSDVFLTAGTTGLLANLTKALTKPGGAYAVRAGVAGANLDGPADPSNAVLTSDLQSGAEPTSATWAAWFGSRTLLYAYQTEEFDGELTAGIIGNAAWDWSLVRSGGTTETYPGKGKVTVCLTVDDVIADPAKFRLQKPATILEVATPVTGVCPGSTASSLGVRRSALPFHARIAEYAAELLLPARLHAAFFLGQTTTKPTGSAGSFSPFQGGNPDEAVVEWVHPPADGTLSGGIPSTDPDGAPVTVKVTGGEETNWQGVKLRVFGEDNNGAKVEFSGSCVDTEEDGMAEFPALAAPKTGGFNVFVETHPLVTDCSVDPDVAGFDQVVVPAPQRIIVRP